MAAIIENAQTIERMNIQIGSACRNPLESSFMILKNKVGIYLVGIPKFTFH